MVYMMAYFIVNVILVFKMINNVYYVPHEPGLEKEMKEEFSFFLPLILLFGTILIVMEYIYRKIDGE